MSQTNMEGPNDLAVVVFVQNDDDKLVFQSEQADVAADSFDAYSITYNISDSDGNPVDSAELYLQSHGTHFSNTSGQIVYENVLPGTYSYNVIASGLFPVSGDVTVVDQDVVVDIVMEVPTYYFYEDFANDIPAEWTVHVAGTDYLYWFDGYVIFFRQGGPDGLIMLVSPEINIEPALMLYFDMGEDNFENVVSFGYMTDPNDPETYVELNTYMPGVEWEQYEYDLTSYDFPQNNVYFAWQHKEAPLNGTFFSLDNVIVTAGPTGIDENLAKLTAVYPNPANDVVNIESAYLIENVKVYNISGQIIEAEVVNSNRYQFNTSLFESGIYLFRIETTAGSISKRVIIE